MLKYAAMTNHEKKSFVRSINMGERYRLEAGEIKWDVGNSVHILKCSDAGRIDYMVLDRPGYHCSTHMHWNDSADQFLFLRRLALRKSLS